MRKLIGLAMMGASLLLIVLGVWLLLRPDSPTMSAAPTQSVAVTPNFTRVTLPESATQAAPPTKLTIAPTVAEPTVQSIPGVVKRITPAELQKRLAEPNPPLVWELRSPDRYAQGHIPGSQLVVSTEVAALAEKLDRGQAIVTSCD